MAAEGTTTKDKEFQVITSALDDCRRLIAAGKAQRWDAFKWGVAINLGLATAAATPALNRGWLLWLAWAAASASLALVGHYNRRISGARATATTLIDRLSSFGINYNEIMTPTKKPEPTKANRFWGFLSWLKDRFWGFLSRLRPPLSYEAGEYYDWQELWIFTLTLGGSWLLVLLSLVAKG